MSPKDKLAGDAVRKRAGQSSLSTCAKGRGACNKKSDQNPELVLKSATVAHQQPRSCGRGDGSSSASEGGCSSTLEVWCIGEGGGESLRCLRRVELGREGGGS